MPGPNDKINLVRPDGTVVSATPADARLLLGLGYRPEDPDEQLQRAAVEQREADYSTVGQKALAFGEGVVSGLIPGADYLMADDATSARAEFNPGTRFLGELGGSLIPIAPASLIGKAVGKRVAGEAVEWGLKAKVAKGVAEGAAFGAQSELSRSALSGDPVSAEQMLAGMGLGAVFGGGAEALAHGVSTMAARAKAGAGGARTARELAAEMRTTSHAPQASVDEFFPPQPGRAPHTGTPSGAVSGGADIPYTGGRGTNLDLDVPAFEGPPPAAARYSPRLPSTIVGNTAQDAQDAIAHSIIEPGTWKRLRTTVSEVADAADDVWGKAELSHDNAMAEYKKWQTEVRPQARRKYGEEVVGTATFKNTMRKGTPRNPAKMGDPLYNQDLSDLAANVRAKFRASAAAAHGMDGKAAQLAKEEYDAAIDELAAASGHPAFEELAKPARDRLTAVQELAFATKTLREVMPRDATEYLLFRKSTAEKFEAAVEQVLASKLPEAEASQKALTALVDEMAERAGISHQGGTAQKLRALGEAGHGTLSKVAGDFNQRAMGFDLKNPKYSGVARVVTPPSPSKAAATFDDGMASVDADVGDVDWGDVPTVEEAVKSSKARQAEHGIGGQIGKVARREAVYKGASPIAGTRHDSIRSMARYGLVALFLGAKGLAAEGAKNAALKVLQSRAGTALAKGVSAVGPRAYGLYRSVTGPEDTRASLTERFKARSDELRNIAVAGKDQAFAFSQSLAAAGHPEFAFALYQAATRAQDAIVTRLPKDPPGTRWGTEWIWDAPPEQVEVFAQEYSAAMNPMEFLEAVADDPEAVHPSAVKVFEEAWPNLYAEFRATAVTQLMAQGTEGMDIGQLTSLSVLFDLPLSPLNDPAFIAAQQAMNAPDNQPVPPKNGGGGSSSGSPGRPPGNDATAMQRLNARG